MGKRIVLIDYNEIPNYSAIYGKGLPGDIIFSLEMVNALSQTDRNNLLTFGPGDAVMLVGAEPFKYLQQFYHFGVRNENYFDCSKLYRLSMTGGGFARVCAEIPEQEDIVQFMSEDFTYQVEFPEFQQKVLKTYEEVILFLQWLENRPEDEDFGFDYEASGMPLDKWFELSGASICNVQYSGFISFTDLRRNCTPDQYREILQRLGDWLQKRMNHVWVYNMQYEFQVSHRMLGVDLYDLCDASVVNVLDGHHMKKYSLKWTAQRVLGVNVWDQDFDKLSDLLEDMYFDIIGKTKKDKQKVFKVTKENFHLSEEFKEIVRMFPIYEEEFKRLILEYWGCPFMNIPSDILGYYCNLDSYYTLRIFLNKKYEYSEEAWNVFLDNARFGCRLHSQGVYINEDFRLQYKEQSEKMMAWGITYCAISRCALNIRALEKQAANIDKYPPHCKTLLMNDMFCSGNIVDITKRILSSYIDTMDVYEHGLDEGRLSMDLGDDFAAKFIDLLKESMTEVKFKGKIDDGIVRKKKLLGVLGEKLKELIEIDKVKLDSKKHLALESLLVYQRAFTELQKISSIQMPDIYTIPDEIRAFGITFSIKDYSDYVSNNFFKCKSPIENDNIITEMWNFFRSQTAFIGAILESQHHMDQTTDFFKVRNLNTPTEGYNHFMAEWEQWIDHPNFIGSYPNKAYEQALKFWQEGIKQDIVKEVWTDFKGFNTQAAFWKDTKTQHDLYAQPFDFSDLDDDFFFMRKFLLNYMLYKKYAKVLSTYILGVFGASAKWVIEGPDHIPLRYAEPDEPGAILKTFTHYEVNTKSSKRWSAAWHTILLKVA